ncbi:hypothetical protein [Bacteroides reticulotermitis]|uniref:Uncharacterized protein n=2 Tax=Bacteroides reticulotermitis TaxID=1133319 RepID=W4UT87_9BACE|nr:hypothetical protein [Bacteroides reticulotermitis]MBB4045352.1 hypothetical protein [Bacteroides reticulotermitis]GAE84161.1 hypothetical protein JCM10512_2486 [Bacteroides reticulotermitis JCM 10512]
MNKDIAIIKYNLLDLSTEVSAFLMKYVKRERDERNQEQANVAKSLDANVSGVMPNRAAALKRDLNDEEGK